MRVSIGQAPETGRARLPQDRTVFAERPVARCLTTVLPLLSRRAVADDGGCGSAHGRLSIRESVAEHLRPG
jgi:hypothetical protein